MRKGAKPNGHWISEVSVTKTSSKEFTINMSPAKCGDNLPLFGIVGAQSSDGVEERRFNFTEFASDVTIRRKQAAHPPLTGVFDLSHLNKTVKGKVCIVDRCWSNNSESFFLLVSSLDQCLMLFTTFLHARHPVERNRGKIQGDSGGEFRCRDGGGEEDGEMLLLEVEGDLDHQAWVTAVTSC